MAQALKNIPDLMSGLSFPVMEKGAYQYVDTRPESDRIPIIFLHGMLGDVSNWNPTLAAVHSEGYRAIAPILPVYSIRLQDANLDGLVRYVMGFLEAMNIERCTLVGNSLGGHLAALLSVRRPEVVQSLVLTGASGVYEVDLGNSTFRRKDREYLKERAQTTFYDPAMCTEQLLDHVFEIVNTRENVMRLIRIARSVKRGSVLGLLGRIKAPALLVWGREDQITPLDVAESYRDGIESAELRVLDRCGHAPMIEKPNQFCDFLLTFLEEIPVNASQALAS